VRGNQVRITAKVWAFGPNDRVEFWLTEDPTANPIIWEEVAQVPAEQFSIYYDISIDATLKSSSLQAVRVIMVDGSNDGNNVRRSCPTEGASGTFSDTDDLIFPVDTTSSGGILSLAPLPVDNPIPMIQIDCTAVPPERCAFSSKTCPDACKDA